MVSDTAYQNLASRTAQNTASLFVRDRGRWILFAFWLIAIAVYWYATQSSAPTAVDKVKLLCDIAVKNWWGPFFFIVAFAIQPLVLFPTFLMTVAAGILYGPLWGMIYSFIGANAAASLSYSVGRLLGAETFGHLVEHPRMAKHVERLRTNTFETILVLGFLHAPFDILNFVSGILRLRWWQFALATALAIVPGGLPFVLFGSSLGSLENLTATGRPDLNIPLLILSIVIAILAMSASSLLRKRME